MNSQVIDLLVKAVMGLGLLALGFLAGRVTERRHLARLTAAESLVRDIVVTDLKSFPSPDGRSLAVGIVVGEAVVATDFFKSFIARLRSLLGGELGSYLSLVDRARREATVRMLTSARELGCNAVCNVRLETADIGKTGLNSGGMTTIAIIASGTAYRIERG